ncbi:DUF2839 family protein [Gloeothece verrucosa]|uniref:Uncharacterized protein n=1 Tax=Gloeothece verrucosa (strain PCC 7822) TaxID=497965 RepID=E0UNF2_GLOV7|nr:DUF2839 family protein [Gloeothece verrucosa]ADN18482.1 conserved hypothetical protein [Gloeothece verrucosa PCC 7822]
MGEAKRRKKNLGDDYGQKKFSRLHSYQWEKHLLKFFSEYESQSQEFETKFISLNDDEKNLAYFQEYQKWIESYLSFYHPEDREKLGVIILGKFYDELERIQLLRDHDNRITQVAEWVMQVVLVCFYFKKYLSPRMREEYIEPLQPFYEDLILNMTFDENLKSGPNPITLKKLFEEILEIPSPTEL